MVSPDRSTAASVMTVQQWCAQNAVNPKTYYYHLKKVRAQYLESAPSIVPLTAPQISYPYRKERIANSPAGDVDPETMLALVRKLC